MRPGSCWGRGCRSCSPRAPIRCARAWPPAPSPASMRTRAGARRPWRRSEAVSEHVLVVNAGSSSLKFEVFAVSAGPGEMARKLKGQIDGIGTHPRFTARNGGGTVAFDETFQPKQVKSLPDALHIARER